MSEETVSEEVNTLAEDGYAVGRLISFALRNAKPSRDSEYRQLIDRYKYEDGFAAACDQVLEGLGLQILNETTQGMRAGLVLGCHGYNSPFAPNIESHARGLNAEQRMALAIIHLAIMSYYYPQVDEDEDDFRSRSGTPSEMATDIRQVCETLATSADSGEIEPPNDVRLAYEAFLTLPPAPARGGFLTKSTQVGLVNHALSELQRSGFLAVDGGDGPNTRFVSLPGYRIYVRRLASHHAAKLIRDARQKMAASHDEQGDASDV